MSKKKGAAKSAPPGDDPGDETKVQARHKRIYQKLENEVELWKLHVAHNHMSLPDFKARASKLEIPKRIYDLYDKVCKSCDSCGKFAPAPERSRVSGWRAYLFGDIWFIDHVKVTIGTHHYIVFVVVDAATNFIMAEPQRAEGHEHSMEVLRKIMDDNHCTPKAIMGDDEFFERSAAREWQDFFRSLGVRQISQGPNIPWPIRAEATVKLQKHHMNIFADSVERLGKTDPAFQKVAVRTIVKQAQCARNVSVTNGGKTPMELKEGRRPPGLF